MKSHLRVHYFQHIAGEGYGSCETYLKQHQAQISATEFFALPPGHSLEMEALSQVEEVDLLIIMGGKMSVNDEANYPWLTIEKRWLRRYLSLGRPAIGLCLGGQLIANALGAAVSHNPVQELGWHTVKRVENLPTDCFQFPEEINVLQWHSETFALPKGATHLATNEACRHQAYQLGSNVLGFQFHPEITPAALALFLTDDEECSKFKGPYVQSEAVLKVQQKDQYIVGNRLLNAAIDYVVENTMSPVQMQ